MLLAASKLDLRLKYLHLTGPATQWCALIFAQNNRHGYYLTDLSHFVRSTGRRCICSVASWAKEPMQSKRASEQSKHVRTSIWSITKRLSGQKEFWLRCPLKLDNETCIIIVIVIMKMTTRMTYIIFQTTNPNLEKSANAVLCWLCNFVQIRRPYKLGTIFCSSIAVMLTTQSTKLARQTIRLGLHRITARFSKFEPII